MSTKSFLKPFVGSVATLLAASQSGAAMAQPLPAQLIEAAQSAQPVVTQNLTLSNAVVEGTSTATLQQAGHGSHSSHSSHASHSSHSSSSFFA
jgi:hypothetical protein